MLLRIVSAGEQQCNRIIMNVYRPIQELTDIISDVGLSPIYWYWLYVELI